MVKVSTLFHRVDGFDETSVPLDAPPEVLDLEIDDLYLKKLMKPLLYDPGDKLVQEILQKT
jgi:hypothetical protein